MALEDKGHLGSNARIFSSNIRHDCLLFVSQNSDIKIINMKTGKFIGDIGGAHFKGVYNFGLLVGAGLQNKLKDRMENFEIKEGERKADRVMDIIIEQLNEYMLVSCSLKDKLKVWKFQDGVSSPISQANCIGGNLDSPITLLNTINKEVSMLVMGNASNKVEIFIMK